ncbi:MAG TPA: hypothetical protein PK036_02235 [Geobacteraceae bacterium]|nr:hypothetical protein [Geobacteraceae bacterium]
MTGCAQRTGFLTLTTCGEPVAAACTRCGKAICAGHIHHTQSGILCPDCAVLGLDADEASRRGLDSSYYRHSADSDTGMVTYGSSDYENFDTFEGEGGEMGGGGAGGEWDEGEAAEESGSESADEGDFGAADEGDSGSSDDFQDS